MKKISPLDVALLMALVAITLPSHSVLGQAKSPQDFVPGLIARAYLGGDTDAKKYPTHCVAVIQTGQEFIDKYKPLAEAELRGRGHTNEVFYFAFGYIVLEQDANVRFEMGENMCSVRGKEFGTKTFLQRLKAGKYPVEVSRRWGHGQGDFKIFDQATNASVLFHTGQMLSRELTRAFKTGNKTSKSIDLGNPDANKKP